MIQIFDTQFPEVKRIKRHAFIDERGFFSESYRQSLYEEGGITTLFVQDNHSFSKNGVIRGLHFQEGPPGQAKLVAPLVGQIFDVFVDIRPASPTFGQWGGITLCSDKHDQLFIPAGFAHGFAALTDAHVTYKVSTPFNPATEKTISYHDPFIGVEWPIDTPIVSERDRTAPLLGEVVR